MTQSPRLWYMYFHCLKIVFKEKQGVYDPVRLPLQPTTPHWETPSMAVRAILLPVCHHRTAQGLPDWIQTMFGRAVFIQLLA